VHQKSAECALVLAGLLRIHCPSYGPLLLVFLPPHPITDGGVGGLAVDVRHGPWKAPLVGGSDDATTLLTQGEQARPLLGGRS
jgi:hypothetical protein